MEASSFRVRRALPYRNSFAPIAIGTFTDGARGTNVAVRLQVQGLARAFMLLWLGFAGVWTAVAAVVALVAQRMWWLPFGGIGIAGIGWALLLGGFLFEAPRTIERLRSLLDGSP